MVAAHLRGLLKPTLAHGLRSYLSEEIILEALSSENLADTISTSIQSNLSITSCIAEDSRRDHVDLAFRRSERLAQLRDLDLYCVDKQLLRKCYMDSKQEKISLLQLYKLAEENDVFAQLAVGDAEAEANATPIL